MECSMAYLSVILYIEYIQKLSLNGWWLELHLLWLMSTSVMKLAFCGLKIKVIISGGKVWAWPENSSLRLKVPGYALWQISWKILPQAGCGPAAQPPWPGILRNHFCSVYRKTFFYVNSLFYLAKSLRFACAIFTILYCSDFLYYVYCPYIASTVLYWLWLTRQHCSCRLFPLYCQDLLGL
jgi:hypothetical protein